MEDNTELYDKVCAKLPTDTAHDVDRDYVKIAYRNDDAEMLHALDSYCARYSVSRIRTVFGIMRKYDVARSAGNLTVEHFEAYSSIMNAIREHNAVVARTELTGGRSEKLVALVLQRPDVLPIVTDILSRHSHVSVKQLVLELSGLQAVVAGSTEN